MEKNATQAHFPFFISVMFAQPSKRVPSGEFDLLVRFLVPPQVIVEALTDEKAAQVRRISLPPIRSTTRSLSAKSIPFPRETTYSTMEAFKASSSPP